MPGTQLYMGHTMRSSSAHRAHESLAAIQTRVPEQGHSGASKLSAEDLATGTHSSFGKEQIMRSDLVRGAATTVGPTRAVNRIVSPKLKASSGSHPRTVTPVEAVVRGTIAGMAGTAAMDTLSFARYRRDGGASGAANWEPSAGLTSWEEAPAPAQVGKRLLEGLFDVKLSSTRARTVNNVMR